MVIFFKSLFRIFYVQIFEHDFVGDKEKIRRHTLCLARISDAASGKICRKDVQKRCETGSYLNVKGIELWLRDKCS